VNNRALRIPGNAAPALVQARCALGIVHAQYFRALMLAEGADEHERTVAFAEARRLLIVAVGLRRRAQALEAAEAPRGHPAEGTSEIDCYPGNPVARLSVA
jgi:hypothetical protein